MEKLFLNKEEIPIIGRNFKIPIHPELFGSNFEIDDSIAKDIFSKAFDSWYDDLETFVKYMDDPNLDHVYYDLFSGRKPSLIQKGESQIIEKINWRDDFSVYDNGLVNLFCIERNHGGALLISDDYLESISPVPSGYIRFGREKAREFEFKEGGAKIYSHLNVRTYPGALFLRNWAIEYVNKAFDKYF